jgi:acyl-CoA thioester hydrolase
MSEVLRFYVPVKVRFNETDLQGHVNFGHFLFYFDIALVEFMDEIGYGYETMLKQGTDIVYAESHCNYHSPAHWPEVLLVYARIANLGERSIRYEFEIRGKEDKRPVASGHIVAVTVAKETFEPAPIPNALRAAVRSYDQSSES